MKIIQSTFISAPFPDSAGMTGCGPCKSDGNFGARYKLSCQLSKGLITCGDQRNPHLTRHFHERSGCRRLPHSTSFFITHA